MEKVNETIHKVTHPKEHSSSTTTGTTTTGTHTGTGHHHEHNSGVTGTAGTAGPHSSNLANKADPRVDSDLDCSRNAGVASYGTGANQNYGNTGTGLTSSHNTAGPHSSDLANKVDSRVDSDLDGSRNTGAASYGTGASQDYSSTGTGLSFGTGYSTGSTTGSTTGTGYNTGSTTGTGYNTSPTNTGPHNSNIANKLDPRVDSDNDGSRNAGAASYGAGGNNYGSTGTGNYGSTGAGNYGSTSTGLTGSNQNYGATGSGLTGGLGSSGPAPNTAGPHKSDLLNKVDPRVDSDRDGSRTVGSAPNTNTTY